MQELYLTEVVERIRSRGILVFVVTAIFAAVGFGYVFTVQPVFRVEVRLLPPKETTVQALYPWLSEAGPGWKKFSDSGFIAYKADEVYEFAVRNLRSHQLRWVFFTGNGLAREVAAQFPELTERELFAQVFDTQLHVMRNMRIRALYPYVSVTLYGTDPERTSRWLNAYVSMVDTVTAGELVEFARERIAAVVRSMITEAEAQRRTFDRLRAEGQHALAEAEAGRLYVLEARIAALRALSIDSDQISTMIVDKSGDIPSTAARPRRVSIIGLSLAAGFALGILLACVTPPLRRS